MAKRMILMLGVMATLLTALGFMKFRQIQTAVQASAYQPPPEAVTSVVAQAEVWPATTGVIGTMEAVHGVMVSSDLPGTVTKINFDSGKAVHEGDILVELDTREERAQLASLEAQRDLAKSEAAGAEEVEMQRASDVLAEKLPGLEDPNAPKVQDDSKTVDGVDTRPLKPLTAARPDRFSPSEVRPASRMTPGKAAAITSAGEAL